MKLKVGVAHPPYLEGRVAQFHYRRDDGIVEIPADMYRAEDGRFMIILYSRDQGPAFEYPVAEFLAAISRGMEILEIGMAAFPPRDADSDQKPGA